MTTEQIQAMILAALRRDPHGLDHWQIAATIAQAPFRVRAELRVLKRRGLVIDHGSRIVWTLTSQGWHHADQLEFDTCS